MKNKSKNKAALFLCSLLLMSCSETLERLKRIGQKPKLSQVELPRNEEPSVHFEQSRTKVQSRNANSLWQPGSTTFFRDSRAWKIGDIIRVVVEIKDSAKIDSSTQQKRSGNDSMGIAQLFGKEKTIGKTLNTTDGSTDPLLGVKSSRSHTGGGKISRTEDIRTEIAAMVTKVLPNGNLVIEGRQEVRVNYELRSVEVAGIIRPKDISTDNSISSNQMAEARISYGGKGVVSDVQQPRVGSQVIDIISPF